MIASFFKKVFGTANERVIKNYQAIVQQINALEASLEALSDQELQQKTPYFKQQLQNGKTLDDILPEAFAVCREASKRVLKMRHFDVQLIGGMVLHHGKIAEMKTGEGKTLVATLPCYLNALSGKGVHVVTVNDYLARRDAEWMGKLHSFLGLSVGIILHGLTDAQRQAAYNSDITYATNNELGFDYLRDNMKFSVESMAQRPLHYAVIDEVDSILIDEARTPLIISGATEDSADKYIIVDRVIPGLQADTHYKLDEKSRSANLTEEGVAEIERRLKIDNLYDIKNIELLHHVTQALKAHTLFKKDVDYVVKDNQVQIVDEFTGRILPGRRWSDGLHQAVEAKEGVPIENENQTLASITYQNYFRMYEKLSGMTGTADTESVEFDKIYRLGVVVVPSHRVSQRKDLNDSIYKTERAKFKAIVEEVKEQHAKKRPVLIGTVAIEKSEMLSTLLERAGIPHHVLNAKQHQREAEIIAQAGRLGAVTVSTNMAGRGTDIILGGNPEFLTKRQITASTSPEEAQNILTATTAACLEEQKKVLELGGLYVIGTERHESRRIDNQLRGRCGRQGDPGQTRFFISLEDDLMRIFGAERIGSLMDKIGMSEDEMIEHRWITRAIEGSQKRVEAHHFEIRKNVLEYDDVMNQQRQAIYSLRKKILKNDQLNEQLTDMIDVLIGHVISFYSSEDSLEQNRHTILGSFQETFGFVPPVSDTDFNDADTLGQKLYTLAEEFLQTKKQNYGVSLIDQAIKFFMLQTLDDHWKDHLLSMDHLRDGIGLRGYGQKDPKQEYKKEGFAMFEAMMFRFQADTVEKIFKVQIANEDQVEIKEEAPKNVQLSQSRELPVKKPQPVKTTLPKVGRNDLCHCGSGKKYKKCHGKDE